MERVGALVKRPGHHRSHDGGQKKKERKTILLKHASVFHGNQGSPKVFEIQGYSRYTFILTDYGFIGEIL